MLLAITSVNSLFASIVFIRQWSIISWLLQLNDTVRLDVTLASLLGRPCPFVSRFIAEYANPSSVKLYQKKNTDLGHDLKWEDTDTNINEIAFEG